MIITIVVAAIFRKGRCTSLEKCNRIAYRPAVDAASGGGEVQEFINPGGLMVVNNGGGDGGGVSIGQITGHCLLRKWRPIWSHSRYFGRQLSHVNSLKTLKQG